MTTLHNIIDDVMEKSRVELETTWTTTTTSTSADEKKKEAPLHTQNVVSNTRCVRAMLSSRPHTKYSKWNLLHITNNNNNNNNLHDARKTSPSKKSHYSIFKDAMLVLSTEYCILQSLHNDSDNKSVNLCTSEYRHLLGCIHFSKQKSKFASISFDDTAACGNDNNKNAQLQPVQCMWQNYPKLKWMQVVFPSCVLYALPCHANSVLSYGVMQKSNINCKYQTTLHLQSDNTSPHAVMFVVAETVVCTNAQHSVQVMMTTDDTRCPLCECTNAVVWKCGSAQCTTHACLQCVVSKAQGACFNVDVECVQVQTANTNTKTHVIGRKRVVHKNENGFVKHTQFDVRRVHPRFQLASEL